MIDSYIIIFVIFILTILFVIGVKVAFFFKNREMRKTIERYENELNLAKQEIEKVKTSLSEDLYKHIKRTEEMYKKLLEQKDEQIKNLVEELDVLKMWKEEILQRLAEFRGASKGSYEYTILRLLEYNQKLNKALHCKWNEIEKNLVSELNQAIEKIKKIFQDAEEMHKDALEIISFYEANIPPEIKKQLLNKASGIASKLDKHTNSQSLLSGDGSDIPRLTQL